MKSRFRTASLAQFCGLWLFLLFSIGPLLIMVMTAFKSEAEVLTYPPTFIFTPIIDNFVQVFWNGPFGHYLLNSAVISLASTLFTVFLGTCAAYGLVRYPLVGPKTTTTFMIGFLFIRMMPPVAIMTPIFILMRNLGLLDTYQGLILLYMAFNLPYSMWMMAGFFREIPGELYEAAHIDGCSPHQVLMRIAFPLVRTGMIATAIFVFVTCWNEFPLAFITTGQQTKTLPVAVLTFRTEQGVHWGSAMAAGSITFLPMLILSLVFQKGLVRGMTAGAVKG